MNKEYTMMAMITNQDMSEQTILLYLQCMTTVRIDILNPKAVKLLKELAALNLIAIREE